MTNRKDKVTNINRGKSLHIHLLQQFLHQGSLRYTIFLTWSIRESALDQLNLGRFRFLKCSHEKGNCTIDRIDKAQCFPHQKSVSRRGRNYSGKFKLCLKMANGKAVTTCKPQRTSQIEYIESRYHLLLTFYEPHSKLKRKPSHSQALAPNHPLQPHVFSPLPTP